MVCRYVILFSHLFLNSHYNPIQFPIVNRVTFDQIPQYFIIADHGQRIIPSFQRIIINHQKLQQIFLRQIQLQFIE